MDRCKIAVLLLGSLVLAVLMLFIGRNHREKRDFSMETLLKTSVLPVGRTMYIWGGGWNEDDTGAGKEAVSIGVSTRWVQFAEGQTSAYDYTKTRYQIHDGLDCSGYIGWLVYNVFHTSDGDSGYVTSASRMARKLADCGFGELVKDTGWKPGDICSMDDHVWMSLGQCSDGSVLLVHASPPGVRISGTCLADGTKSKALMLAEQVMKICYGKWYGRYPECGVPDSYLAGDKFRWYTSPENDPHGLQEKSAEEIVRFLYNP